jgi:hypothetical protein
MGTTQLVCFGYKTFLRSFVYHRNLECINLRKIANYHVTLGYDIDTVTYHSWMLHTKEQKNFPHSFLVIIIDISFTIPIQEL